MLRQLGLVLREVRGHDAVAELDAARVGLACAEEGLEQGRLPRAVRADERDVLAALEHERRPVEEQLVAGAQHDSTRITAFSSREKASSVQFVEPVHTVAPSRTTNL